MYLFFFPLVLAISSGMLLGLAWPTYGIPFFLFFSFVPLLWAEDLLKKNDKIKKKLLFIFFLSFICFSIWNAITTYWLYDAKRIDGSSSLEAFIFPLLFNSLFMSLFFWLFSWIKKGVGETFGQLFFITSWICFEKLHKSWEIAWPWLELGNGFASKIKWIQWYEYTGVSGGTLWILLLNCSFFNLSKALFKKPSSWLRLLSRKGSFIALKILIPILLSYLIFLNYQEKGKAYQFLILQPNLDSYKEKYNQSDDHIINDLLLLIKEFKKEDTAFIIAPETAIPGKKQVENKYLMEDFSTYQIMQSLNNTKATFITGAELFSIYPSKEKASDSAFFSRGSWMDIFNSALAFNKKAPIQIYHKSKLVPAVEVFPYKKFLEPLLGNILLDFGGTTKSHGKQKESSIFSHPFYPIKAAPVICYESVFGEYVASYIQKGAHFITIVTNDGWWGNSQGHKQHLFYARLRAIENRRSIARSANTGISAFINQKGEFISTLAYGKKGVLESTLRANDEKTFYTQYEDLIARGSLFITGVLFSYGLLSNKKRKNNNLKSRK